MNAPLKVIPDAEHDRRRYLGGSDAAAIMGLSKFRTPYQVYLAKTSETREELDPDRKKFFERRKRLEPVIIQAIKEDYEAEIVATNQRYVDAEFPFMAAEIDFEPVLDGKLQNGEAKTVHAFVHNEKQGWGEVGTDEFPIDYWIQVQHGLGVTGRDVCVLAAMVGLDDPIFYVAHRDEEDIRKIRETLCRFWNDNVLARKAPDPSNLEDLHRIYGKKSNGLILPADDETASKALRLRAICAQMDALALERESLEFDVCRRMGEHDELHVGGRKVCTWKETSWSRLDQKGLRAKYPKIHKEFQLSGTHRVFVPLRST